MRRQQAKGLGTRTWTTLLLWIASACSGATESDTLAPVIHGVTVTIDGGGAVTLRWSTNELATSFVDHGETDSYGTRLDASVTFESEHAVQLTGLALGGTYHFRITATDAMSNSSSTPDDSFVNAEIGEAEVEGNLVAWCPLQLTFRGPLASETDDAPNPFLQRVEKQGEEDQLSRQGNRRPAGGGDGRQDRERVFIVSGPP